MFSLVGNFIQHCVTVESFQTSFPCHIEVRLCETGKEPSEWLNRSVWSSVDGRRWRSIL